MSENLWEKKHRQPNYIEKKKNSFLIENNSLDRYVLFFQNQKENLHNISMAGFLVGSS